MITTAIFIDHFVKFLMRTVSQWSNCIWSKDMRDIEYTNKSTNVLYKSSKRTLSFCNFHKKRKLKRIYFSKKKRERGKIDLTSDRSHVRPYHMVQPNRSYLKTVFKLYLAESARHSGKQEGNFSRFQRLIVRREYLVEFTIEHFISH